MAVYEYSIKFDPTKSGRSQRYDVDASYKDLNQAANAIKGKGIVQARKVLNDAIEMEKPIRFYKFAKGAGHQGRLGGKKGKYPKKECAILLSALNEASANATSKGVDEKNQIVLHAMSYKHNVYPRYRKFFVSSHTIGYGKQAIMSNYTTARIEIAVGEKGAKKLPRLPKKKALALLKVEKAKRAAQMEKA